MNDPYDAGRHPPGDLDDCSRCGGYGETPTRQDYWGMWDTRTCPHCDGTGQEP